MKPERLGLSFSPAFLVTRSRPVGRDRSRLLGELGLPPLLSAGRKPVVLVASSCLAAGVAQRTDDGLGDRLGVSFSGNAAGQHKRVDRRSTSGRFPSLSRGESGDTAGFCRLGLASLS